MRQRRREKILVAFIIYLMPLRLFNIVLLVTLFFYCIHAHAQARGSIGFGAGPALPLESGYKVGNTWALQASAKLSNKFALTPTLSIERIVSQNKGHYNGYYFEGSPRGINLLMLSLPVHYYITEGVFAALGPTLFVGGEDASSSGIGGTGGVGYDLPVDAHNSFELMLHCDRVLVYDHPVTLLGLRLTYKFNFRRR
jgi:hypothetical protein